MLPPLRSVLCAVCYVLFVTGLFLFCVRRTRYFLVVYWFWISPPLNSLKL